MSKLDEVEFADDEVSDFVEPFLDMVDSFADALFTTLVLSHRPGSAGEELNRRKRVRRAWRLCADRVLRFMKVVDNG